MTILWRANASMTGPKSTPTPGRFHQPREACPRVALCGADLRRAVYEGGGALDKCRVCLRVLRQAREEATR